ncbi:MAG: hypothetical protein SV201_08500 [Pseudomonadota bacterium]|nr:hypothetical protein [Pseudomonadota bacterium]
MFNKNSRYANSKTVSCKDSQGHSVTAVRLRRLPATTGVDALVTDGAQLDVMCEKQYHDATRFWHIADANSDLEANALVKTRGSLVKVPEK